MSADYDMASGIKPSAKHFTFLQKRALSLKPHERDMSLSLDEIHIFQQTSYTGGRLEGAAFNKDIKFWEKDRKPIFSLTN